MNDAHCFWRLSTFHELLQKVASEAVTFIRTDPMMQGQDLSDYAISAAIKGAASNHHPAIFKALEDECRAHVERTLRNEPEYLVLNRPFKESQS